MRNTWTDWRLIPTTPPMIFAPSPNKNLVNIPGRREGPIDMSRVPFGILTYPRITGNWEFIYEETSEKTRYETYDAVRKWLNGRTTTVKNQDDPYHYFRGIFTVGNLNSNENTAEISISYDLEPIRYNQDGTEDTNYLIR